MAHARKKKRTQQKGGRSGAAQKPNDGSPKSMVIRIGAGEVGASVSQLTKDVRQVMEPGTAARLKERRANKLRDYTTMCGPLGVSHLLLFSRSATGNTNLRLARTPRGPTLNFRVEKYSLCKDIHKSQKHPRGSSPNDYKTAPLLVMNNFITAETAAPNPKVPKHLERLVTEMFQSLFPPIAPQTTPLSSIRRVLLLNREPAKDGDDGSYIVNLRHYAITTKRTGLPKAIKRLRAAEKVSKSTDKRSKGLPNLGKLEDVADFMLDPSGAGYTSASDTEIETDAEVEVLQTATKKVLGKRELQKQRETEEAGKPQKFRRSGVEKRAVKLVELGPRLKLRLIKVEEEISAGKVLWHEHKEKSAEEIKEMDVIHAQRRKDKEERRRIQRENVERKKKEKAESKGEGEEGEDDDEDEDMYDYDMDDDVWQSADEDEEEDGVAVGHEAAPEVEEEDDDSDDD